MIFIILGGLVFKDMAPFRGSFISRLTFCADPPIILNCRHAKTKRSWDLKFAEFLSFNDIYKYT